MILKDLIILINQLQEENKTNSKEERTLNENWIKGIKHSINEAFKKL